jgi:hypothetical protein
VVQAMGGERKATMKKFTSKIAPSFFGSFSSKGQSVMSEGSTFDHSARLEPAIPGFPVLISRVSSYKGWSRVYYQRRICEV